MREGGEKVSKLSEAIFELLEAGADPNDLAKEFEVAVLNSGCDWALFGDGRDLWSSE